MSEYTLIQIIEKTLDNGLVAAQHSVAYEKCWGRKRHDALRASAHWWAKHTYEGFADNSWALAKWSEL